MELFHVDAPGAYTTIQDLGRYGYQQMGLPVTGALDRFAHEVANLLVDNPPDCACLEMTLTGPRLEIRSTADLAVTGADINVSLNQNPVSCWASFQVNPGDILEIHQVQQGCRAYLAVGNGLDVPILMGSRSTYVGGAIGGFKGRPLQQGDLLKAYPGNQLERTRRVPREYIPRYPSGIKLRVVPGPQDDYFTENMQVLFAGEYMVTPKADRMGYRLAGERISIDRQKPKSIISEPSMPGGIQIPADEQPIILLVEQTAGGYAKIATVVSPDLSRVAQATPGDMIRFVKVDLATAHTLYHDHRKKLEKIKEAI